MKTNKLELKIHPPVVALIAAVISWVSAKVFINLKFEFEWKWGLALSFIIIAGVLGGLGIKQFFNASTTIHPHKPQHTQKLVTDGLYRYTRNPMYLGLLSGLIAWTILLTNPVSILGPVFFVVYITRFQIIPEERILSEKFGQTYSEYVKKVRRWV